ncbi:hypothetical protein IAQ61_007576 [Plenodomus lingam]|nr:hypothetical protein IAQ61_007576 [Plenodomus lingam]
MGFSTLRIAILGLTLLVSTTSATISLSNFTPRIDNLPAQCATVYTTNIEGCVAGDFSSTDGSTPICSEACLQGLAKIQNAVSQSCAGVDVGETSIIGVFQNGLGLRALCPAGTVTSQSSSTTKTTTTKVSVPPRSSAGATTTTSSAESVRPSGVASASSPPGTEDAQSSSLSGSRPSLDTFTTSAQATNVAPSSTARASTTRAPSNQLSNTGSGGGSPFDVVAVASSSQLKMLNMTVASLIATAVLFFACA